MTFSTSQCQDGVKVLNRLWMKMSGPLKDSFENLKTRNSASRILTGIFSKKLENSELSQNLGLKFVTHDINSDTPKRRRMQISPKNLEHEYPNGYQGLC